MRSESYRNVKKDTNLIKEFTLDAEVGPMLVSIQERQGSIRSALQFNWVDEETFDEDHDVEKLRMKLRKKYAPVLKHDLGPKDRVDMDPVKVEVVDESKGMGNAMIAVETPCHLQDAAAN